MTASGYTLTEMLVVLAILALVLTLTVPRFLNEPPDPSAYSVSLSTYLNAASSYASSHETGVCVSREEGSVRSVPWEERFTVPPDLEIDLPPFCYDHKGRVSEPVTILLMNAQGEQAHVEVGLGYGNAGPAQ